MSLGYVPAHCFVWYMQICGRSCDDWTATTKRLRRKIGSSALNSRSKEQIGFINVCTALLRCQCAGVGLIKIPYVYLPSKTLCNELASKSFLVGDYYFSPGAPALRGLNFRLLAMHGTQTDGPVCAVDSPVCALDTPVRAQDSPVRALDIPARETEPDNGQSVMCGVSHVHGQQLTITEPTNPLNSSCSISEEDSGFLTPSADKPAESAGTEGPSWVPWSENNHQALKGPSWVPWSENNHQALEGPSWVPWSENNHQALVDLIRECRHYVQPQESLQDQGQCQVPARVDMDNGGTTICMELPQ